MLELRMHPSQALLDSLCLLLGPLIADVISTMHTRQEGIVCRTLRIAVGRPSVLINFDQHDRLLVAPALIAVPIAFKSDWRVLLIFLQLDFPLAAGLADHTNARRDHDPLHGHD